VTSASRDAAGAAPVISAHERLVAAPITIERVHRVRFPTHRIGCDDGTLVAETGWFSWLAVYFGPGLRLHLADGTPWRIRSVEYGGALCPVLADPQGRRIAMATQGDRGRGGMERVSRYGINGPDYGFVLNAADPGMGRARRWLLVEHEEEIAVVTRRPTRMDPHRPVPLGAAVLCLLLARFGLPGDADLGAPRFRWD